MHTLMWTLSVESLGSWPMLRLSGHLVQGLPADSLAAAVRDLISQGRFNIVCLASEVGVVDSTGTGVLVSVRDMAQRAGGRFILCAPSKRLLAVLSTTHLIELFEIAGDEAAALEAQQAPSLGT